MTRRGRERVMRGAVGVAVALLIAVQAGAASIRMRSSAVVGQSQEGVRLAQLAELEGGAAEELGDVVVLTGAELAAGTTPWMRVGVGEVKRALTAHGANLGRIALSGSACLVRIDGPRSDAHETEPRAPEAPAEPEIVDASGAPTVKSLTGAALARLYGVDQRDIRFVFEEKDQPLLGQSEWGRRIVVQPVTAGSSSRVMVEVRIYAGDRLVANERLVVDVEVRRSVVTVTSAIERRSAVSPEALSETTVWMRPTGAAPIGSIEQAAGSVARTRLEAGSIVRESDIEPPVLVRRNELITVLCVHSGFEIKTRARAKQEGRAGDLIELALEGSRKPFLARVQGPGLAVADMDRPALMARKDAGS